MMDIAAVAHYWTSGRKQASFADTVIGTIDHELMAALASRHVVLRHLGLARQVVVLDEIHAADTWMRVYLERALEWLGRYRVPVVAMSATLPPLQRQGLVDAYERGRRAAQPPREDAGSWWSQPVPEPDPLPEVPATREYPLVTTLAGGEVVQVSAQPPVGRSVCLEWLADDEEATTTAIDEVVNDGGCALVICNTVARAVQRYRSLQERWGDSVELGHSRFVAHDRARNDEHLRQVFGPDADPRRRRGRVVVATQVAEQSLDVDFDVMVTDLAPIDLLLQRIGRLHRHSGRWRPESAREARCFITGMAELPSSGAPPKPAPGSSTVYGDHLLLRTASLVADVLAAGGALAVPGDVPALVERCYGAQRLGPDSWRAAFDSAEQDFREKEGSLASNASAYLLRSPAAGASTIGILASNIGEAEMNPGATKSVRSTDGAFDVILMVDGEDGLCPLPHLGHEGVIQKDVTPSRAESAVLARSMVRIPGWVTSNPRWTDQVLDSLAVNYYPSWQKSGLLAGQLILLLQPDLRGSLGPFRVGYDTEVGLEVHRA